MVRHHTYNQNNNPTVFISLTNMNEDDRLTLDLLLPRSAYGVQLTLDFNMTLLSTAQQSLVMLSSLPNCILQLQVARSRIPV